MFIAPGLLITIKAPLGAKRHAAPAGAWEKNLIWPRAINITRLTALLPFNLCNLRIPLRAFA